MRPGRRVHPSDPEWYKDAIFYELHVRSFQDSNADGIGDFPGLTSRLGYLQDLGITAVWLLPFYPSPLRDDGYDIADYTDVHPAYGTLGDFRRFLDEAHRRGLRVITELVVNHTSDQHPWFQRARMAPPDHPDRNFYVWSASPERYEAARVIFKDAERSNWSWDPVAEAYYWHRFYSHQPDLNFDNPAVFDAVRDVFDFWLGLGVDGMRLDAVPYLVEREGTRSENLRQTHDILKRLRRHLDERFTHRMLLAEANQWPEDAAAYFGAGDESHMVFHFPLMPRLFMAMRQEDRLPIVDILAQTPAAPRGCQWALFLRNHDELTLEMVTEEERQYMYYVYATDPQARINLGIRRRLAPLVGNDRRRMELLNMLLFSLPGTPIVYYGDEIGMGDNIYLGDRNGVRTPMQWTGERNAGFSTAGPQRLFLPLIVDDQYHYQAVHVEQQSANGSSLLSWMKRLIALRKRYQAFGRGSMELVDTPNGSVLAYVRRWRRQQLLVVANLSRFAQHAPLALNGLKGHVPVELLGRTAFPPIGSAPYTLSLAPHACLWFELRSPRARNRREALPRLQVQRHWAEILEEGARADLEAALPQYIETCAAWVSGARPVLSARVEDTLRIRSGRRAYGLLVVYVTFTTGEPQRYLLSLGCRPARQDAGTTTAIATVISERPRGSAHVLYDASEERPLAAALLALARSHQVVEGTLGFLDATVQRRARTRESSEAGRRIRRARQGPNALVPLGRGVVLKLFRQLEEGSPEIEIGSYLSSIGFPHAPAIHGSLHYHLRESRHDRSFAVGVLQQYISNAGEGWARAVAAADSYFTRALRSRVACPAVSRIRPLMTGPDADASVSADKLFGSYLDVVRLIATRTAALHQALGRNTADPAFAPEPLGSLSRRSSYQRMRTLAVSVTASVRLRQAGLPTDVRAAADALASREDDVVRVFRQVVDRAISGQRIRCHGNLHLGQLLHVGDDIVIIDFEGEPGRPLYERRLKRSPLQDVATMIRSFQFAAHAALWSRAGRRSGRDRAVGWLRHWQHRIAVIFADAYVDAMQGSGLLPPDAADAGALLHAHLLERAYYELGFELNHRPSWVSAPLLDIPALLP